MRLTLFLVIWLLPSLMVKAQTKGPTSLDPGRRVVTYSPQHAKKSTRKRRKVQNTPEFEFYQRIERVAKEKQKLFKKYYKAQFTDPRYFGHKRLPKRRSASEMRYCVECGIRH